MRALFCGSRTWTDAELIGRVMDYYRDLHTVIQGEARGADRLSRQAAERRNIEVLGFPADWDKHGRAAGVIRNQQMLDEGVPDIVVAFTDDLRGSLGTGDMVRRSIRADIPVIHVEHGRPRVCLNTPPAIRDGAIWRQVQNPGTHPNHPLWCPHTTSVWNGAREILICTLCGLDVT